MNLRHLQAWSHGWMARTCRHWRAATLSAWVCCFGTAAIYADAGTPPAPGPQAARFTQRHGTQVSMDIALRDELGRPVRLSEAIGDRPMVIALVYYECPMVCNEVLNGLARAARGMSLEPVRDYGVAAVSFDAREGPATARAKKASYQNKYGGAGVSDWQFLTGDASAIKQLTDAVGFAYAYDEASDQFAHPAGLVFLTPEGRVSRYLFGVDYAPRDLKLALIEASDSQIGAASDQLLLLCWSYDPATGKYGLMIMRILRVACIATLAVLGGLVFVMIRSERRKNRRAACLSGLAGD